MIRNSWKALCPGLCALLLACSAEPEIITARLRMHELPSCPLPDPTSLRIRATGDFPAQEQVLPGVAPFDIEPFSADARFLVLDARSGPARAGGVIVLGEERAPKATTATDAAPMLMLPIGRSCPLGDPQLLAARESAIAPLPGGGLLIAGGREADGDASLGSALVVRGGNEFGEQVASGLLLRRAGATATRAGDFVVVAGGAPDQRGPAHDTFEVYDALRGSFDPARSARLSGGPRRDHGAALLPDGRVLVVGGTPEAEGEPRADAEWIDLGGGASNMVDGELAQARSAPSVLVLDGGAVLVALGRDADRAPIGSVERFDPEREHFETLQPELPRHAADSVVALAGDRVLYAGCDGADHPCELALLVPEGDGFARADTGISAEALESAQFHGLDALRAVALADGRVLVIGRSPGAAIQRRAYVVDLGQLSVQSADASRVPSALVTLDDGVLAELDDDGVSLRRETLGSELDDAPAPLISADSLGVALDVRARWEIDGDSLIALRDARFALPFLRFAGVAVAFTLEGEGALLLQSLGHGSVAVAVEPERLAIGDCAIAREEGALVELERRGAEVVLRSGERSRRCAAPGLEGRVGVAFIAREAARIAALRIDRL